MANEDVEDDKMSSNSELTVLQAEWDACMHASMNTTFIHKQEHGDTSSNMHHIKTESLLTQPKQVISKEFVEGNTKLSDMSTG